MHIWLRIIALLFSAHARSSSSTRVSPLLTEKCIYLHDFLTFTDEKYTCDMSVMHWGKHNVSNALNSTDIFAVCHDGSIWFMIDIKGCLRISVHKLVRLCECTLSLITVLALIYLINQNSSQVLDFPAFPQVSVVLLWLVIFTCSGEERTCLRNSLERRNQSTYKIVVTDYWSLSIQ